MATKLDVLIGVVKNEGCLGKSADDEPVFILCGRDLSAPVAVRAWAADARTRGVSAAKHGSALAVADEMDAWVRQHGSKRPD